MENRLQGSKRVREYDHLPQQRDQSLMTFEGAQVQGRQSIMGKFGSLTFKSVKHEVQTVDCQPSMNSGILVMVSGLLKV